MNDNALILLTRVPLPGRTKTRLEAHFTKEKCAKIHGCFIKDIYSTSKKTGADIFVFCTPYEYKNEIIDLLREDVKISPQKGKSLGERMQNAIMDCLSTGYKKCVLIGTDIPTISEKVINKAFIELDHSETVIGPTIDGGYYLIGVTKIYPEIFDCHIYGSDSVFEHTANNMRKSGIKFSIIDTLFDIDTYDDILYLIKNFKERGIELPFNTNDFLCREGILTPEREVKSFENGRNDKRIY